MSALDYSGTRLRDLQSYREAAHFKQGGKCFWCGQPMVEPTAEHLVPRSLGGTDTPENIVAACQVCNGRRGNALPEKLPSGPLCITCEHITNYSATVAMPRKCLKTGFPIPLERGCFGDCGQIGKLHSPILPGAMTERLRIIRKRKLLPDRP